MLSLAWGEECGVIKLVCRMPARYYKPDFIGLKLDEIRAFDFIKCVLRVKMNFGPNIIFTQSQISFHKSYPKKW